MSHQTPANELQTVGNVKFAATVDIESQQASKRLVGGDDASPMISSDYPPDGGCVPCCCYKRRIGNVFVLYENETADGQLDIKLLAPVCWPMIFVSLGAPLSVAFLCFKFTLPQLHWAFSAIGLALVGCFAASLLLTSLRDFGIFPRYHSAQGPNWNWSRQSQSFRPPGVVFCSESKVLVKKLDHFCPWTGTTIASGNILSFYCLLASFWGLVFYLPFSVVYTLYFVDGS